MGGGKKDSATSDPQVCTPRHTASHKLCHAVCKGCFVVNKMDMGDVGPVQAELPVRRAKTSGPTLQSTVITHDCDSQGALGAQVLNSAWAVKRWGGKGHLNCDLADEQNSSR